jgi:hypothetical protein
MAGGVTKKSIRIVPTYDSRKRKRFRFVLIALNLAYVKCSGLEY